MSYEGLIPLVSMTFGFAFLAASFIVGKNCVHLAHHDSLGDKHGNENPRL
jgi:hypothetical protein